MSGIVELKSAVEARSVILFVGSGISAGLGLPDYRQLVDQIAKILGYDPDLFQIYGNFLELAEFLKLESGNIGQLRSWMDREWHNSNIQIEKSVIHRHIVNLDFPLIYTTNYDRWIEHAFSHYKKSFVKVATVKDFVKIDNAITHIVKFHGDFDHEETIVLTESDYFNRLEFSSPMDIRLRSDCLGKSILFLGYSLSDVNVRLLLFKLSNLWQNSLYSSTRPKSFFFSPRPNEIQAKILESRGISFISSEELDLTKATEKFLESLL